ncbi:BRCA2-interacting transcriptional repressor EMSY-like isoform X1 [Vespa mandarinia]|uniref:BRCA2-interacting transcriptional repressor EMSY-like isoform X1 n=2 Tax=Vespa mandarinia TaxID=7446 RepID=UPI00160E24B7|nr:BRCA2-interacting transcriptional repressor EMSY-like isoform X1 [Vespa mandarinia]
MIIIIRESFNDSVSEVQNVENVFELFKKCNINYSNMDNRVLRSVRREMTRDECRKCLRYLELDAYGNMVSVLRAQGPLTSNKQRLLQELTKILHISNERHRAEVRRAVNDEKLTMIAEQLNGPNTAIDWIMEGRRSTPLLPRLKARNAFTMLANSLSLATSRANDNCPIEENKEKEKDILDESKKCFKIEKKSTIEAGSCNAQATINRRKRSIHEANKVLNIDMDQERRPIKIKYQDIQQVNTTKQDLSSFSPPHKVLVLSSNSLETLNHANENETSIETNMEQSETTITSHQGVTVIPLSMTCAGSSRIAPSKDVLSESTNTLVSVHSTMNCSTKVTTCATNSTKNKDKTTVQNKHNTKLSMNTETLDSLPHRNNDTQLKNQDVQLALTSKPEVINSSSYVKNVPSTVQSNVKTVSSIKSAISTYPRFAAPGTMVSSGPGPPSVKSVVTTLACKKLPVAIINQSTAKMCVTLNSDKTVNITNHPNTKLTTKTNVIVIQKGSNKGIMLSHAGKEVLGKVIMGGKKISVANQQNPNTINILPNSINLDNGSQASTMLTATHVDTIKTNIKEGDSNEVHLKDTGSSLKPNSSITTLEETVCRKSIEVCKKIHSQVENTMDLTKLKSNEEDRINHKQFADMQDNSSNNLQREDSMCGMEINTNIFENGFQSTDINLENFECLVENGDHIPEDKNNSISVTYETNPSDS